MKNSNLADALGRIQEIVVDEMGKPLRGAAEARLQQVLGELIAPAHDPAKNGEFLSREVTILLTDLRGFTAVSEAQPVAVVLELLNRYLIEMSKVVTRWRGTIDKFMGDSIMVLFGAPHAADDDVNRAVACAVEMQIAMETLNKRNKEIGMPPLYMGIGINTGKVMAGLLGSDLYSEYTVIGDEVNLASRIEAVSLRGQVLISEHTWERCKDFVSVGEKTEVYVKGKHEPVSLREVLGIPSLDITVPRQEMRRSPRVNAKVEFAYHVVENNVVMEELHQGVTLDVGYHGLLVEVVHPLYPLSEIKLDLELPQIGHTAKELYAKVVKTQLRGGKNFAALEFTALEEEHAAALKRFVHLVLQES